MADPCDKPLQQGCDQESAHLLVHHRNKHNHAYLLIVCSTVHAKPLRRTASIIRVHIRKLHKQLRDQLSCDHGIHSPLHKTKAPLRESAEILRIVHHRIGD